MITERSKNFEGMICVECERGDRLYSDVHGIFCARCGPSVPVKSEIELFCRGLAIERSSRK